MANTAFQNVDDELAEAVAARNDVVEAHRQSVLAGTEPEPYTTWVEVTQAEYDALGDAKREGVLYAIVAE